MQALLVLPLAVAMVVAAAKAHGRQVRLEREALGVMKVDFRGPNDPRVEAIWRRDRRGYWAVFAFLVAWSATLLSVLVRLDRGAAFVATWAALLLAFTFALSFTAMGLWSWAWLGRHTREEAFLRAARQGSLGWWALVVALVAATLAAAMWT